MFIRILTNQSRISNNIRIVIDLFMLQHYKAFTALLCGIVIGVCLNYLLITRDEFSSKQPKQVIRSARNYVEDYKDKNIYITNKLSSKSVRVLCMVMIYSKKSFKEAGYIKLWWGSRCNILLFFYTEIDKLLNNVVLESRGSNNKWGLTKQAFKYVYKHYYDKADWFLKVNTKSFIIMENLRYMLRNYNSTKALYFGRRMKTKKNQSYMDGSAYVLSKEAVKRFAEVKPENKLCRTDEKGLEDVELGICLKNLKVISGDSRDSMGRQRFLNKRLMNYIAPYRPVDWSMEYYETSLEASDNAILINEVVSYIEYYIYHLKPFGITHSDNL